MKKIILAVVLMMMVFQIANAQRITEKLDRGVVVVNKGNNQLFISWRYFATDPEDISFNIYRQVSTATPVKLNATPVTGATNYLWTVTGLGLSVNSRIFVKPLINGVEGAESGSWTLAANPTVGFIVRDFLFKAPPAGYKKMSMKFCWPGDLDGDGQYDFVVDRHPGGVLDSESDTLSATMPTFIDAYKNDGTFKWRINAGTNVKIGAGQAEMVTVYDLDGDNKAEVCMAVSEGTVFADGTTIKNADGTIHNYDLVPGSAPQWIAVVNGETGNLIDTINLALFNEIKSDRSDKWKNISGQFIIQFLDGIHPFLVYQYKTRKATGHFLGGTDTWRLINGKLIKNWAHRYHREDREYEGHQFRAADLDGDGKDELIQMSYAIDDDGSLLYTVPNLDHGDRHCLTDIDPDRPGLEHFFIQQTNILGMGIHDAATGEIIKANYLSAVADVGRGICAAFDPTKRGLQYYSTMAGNAMYNSKGKLTGGIGSFPAEALWWGPGLSRYEVDAAGSDKNPVLEAFSTSSNSVGRNTNLYKMDVTGAPKDYYIGAPNGGRAAFWGDFLGDWREELIYGRNDTLGFVILTTSNITTHRQYCLMQNPAYRIQTTHRGYYQTPDVDFYMATDMPEPPVAPVQTADVYLTSENSFTSDLAGKSVMIDIRNPNTNISLNENLELTRLWLMNPKGHHFNISGTGKFTGAMDVVKSLQGDVTLNGNYDYTGKTRISEGRLFVNGSLTGLLQVDARGVIGGNVSLNGGIMLETGLNIEGGRLEPGNGSTLGNINIVGNLTLPGRNTLAFDLDQTKNEKSDQIHIQGDFTVTGNNHFLVFHPVTNIGAGEFTLLSFTGTSNASKSNFKVKGLEGIPYTLLFEANSIRMVIQEPRASGVVEWKGSNSSVWDFETKNFIKNSTEDIFVPGDSVLFNDNAITKTLTINETMPVNKLIFNNTSNFKLMGDGVISGNSGILKTGTGTLSIINEENSFTGGVDFSDGILEVVSIKDGGLPGSIGASSADASNWIMRNATLQTAGQMASNRNMTVEGKLTVNNPASNHSIMISGNITGTNITLELTGAGALNLQGVNNFSGVTVKSGTLALGTINSNSKGLGTGTITMEGGTLQMRDANSTSTVGPWTNTIHVPEGKAATWNLPMRWNFTNLLTGKGTIAIKVPYVRNEFRGDWSSFEGTMKLITDGDGGDFRINNTFGYGKALVDLASGVSVYHLSTGKTIKLGGLSGVAGAKITGDNTNWMIGGNTSGSTNFAGTISGASSKLTKEGTGTLILNNANTYTGLTEVTGGTLLVTNTTGSATGTNSVMVRSGAKLGGTGTVSGTVAVLANGDLNLQSNAINTFTIGGLLSFATGSVLSVDVNAASNLSDVVKVTGNITIGGDLNIKNLSATEFKAGNEFKIFNPTGTITGSFDSINPGTPGLGLIWDKSALNTGVLKVTNYTATENINMKDVIIFPNPVTDHFTITLPQAESGVEVRIYSLNGIKMYHQVYNDASNQIKIQFPDLVQGVYLVEVHSPSINVLKRIVKQ